MEKRQLGNSDMDITPIGFGAWAIGGGGWAYAWGPQDDKESIETIHRALDQGMNWIDTAAVYGLGRSERVVGEAIKGMAEKPYIFTKCSLVWDDDGNITSSLKANSVRQEVEASLTRLGVETIDLYQIHWPNPDPEIEEGWSVMAELQKEGKLRWIGVSNFNVEQMKRANAIAPITSLQPPYHLNSREIEDEVLPYCEENNIGVIVYSPMQSGLLTGKMTKERVENMPDDDWRKRSSEFQGERLERNLKLAELLGEIGQPHGRTAAEVSIAWTLWQSAVTAAIVGARRPSQVDGIIGAMNFRLSQDEINRIEQWVQANP